MKSARPRVVWLAGTRSEALRLGPLYRSLFTRSRAAGPLHGFALTGEQGMAATQAVEEFGIHPNEVFELRHPAEDPAIRLYDGPIGGDGPLSNDLKSLFNENRSVEIDDRSR